MDEHRAYWIKQYADMPLTLNLPADFPRGWEKDSEGRRYELRDRQGVEGADRCPYEKDEDHPVYVHAGGLQRAVEPVYGEEDIIVGSPIAGRTLSSLEDMVGLVMGSILLRNLPEGRKWFDTFLLEVKEGTLEAYRHQDYSAEELIKDLSVGSGAGAEPPDEFFPHRTEHGDPRPSYRGSETDAPPDPVHGAIQNGVDPGGNGIIR